MVFLSYRNCKERQYEFDVMCDRASHMKMTRGTNLMQQLWFIIINNSTCFGHLYRVSQEECATLREGVPYVKIYRYNPKHLWPNLNGYGDNGQRSLKLWQLLHTYWLPNTYWNWQKYVVSVMLISVLNIKLTCEWHKAIKLNYKNTRTHFIVVLRVPSTIHDMNVKHWPVLPYHQEGST